MYKKSTAKILVLLVSILSCLILFSCADSNNSDSTDDSQNITDQIPESDPLKDTKALYSSMVGTWKHNKTLEIQRINAHSYNYDSNGYIEKSGNFTYGATILAPSYNIVINTDGVYFSKNGNMLKNTLGENFGISYSNLINISIAQKNKYYDNYYENAFNSNNAFSAGSSTYVTKQLAPNNYAVEDSDYDCFDTESEDVLLAAPSNEYFFYLKIKNEKLYLTCIIPNLDWDNLKLTEDDCLNHTYDQDEGVIFAIFEKTNSDNNTETSISSSDLTGSYTISEANGSTFTFASNGTWTYKYNSSTTNGTWAVSNGELTVTYTLGGYSSTAVFTVSISDSNYTLTGKSGDYTTIISSAFKITNQTALENGVVTLVKQ